MPLEGALWRDIPLAGLACLVGLLWLVKRALGGRMVSIGWWSILSAAAGLAFGAGLVFMTLFLMSLKTGLHAHGPEYRPEEIAWLWDQLLVWAGVGGLAGLGLGLLVGAGRSRR